MAYSFKIDNETLKREYSVYVVIAYKNNNISLYIGKTGDNRDGCNPIISRCGNHFSYNKIHSQVRNKIQTHEDWEYTYIYDHFGKYSENKNENLSVLSTINEMERWLNEEMQILSTCFPNLTVLNRFKNMTRISSDEKDKRLSVRFDKDNIKKIENIIYDVIKNIISHEYFYRNIKLSSLFIFEPWQKGLRGDSGLWIELFNESMKIELPFNINDYDDTINNIFKKLIGKSFPLDEDTYLEKYNNGGMSSGYVSKDFWKYYINVIAKNRFIYLREIT